MPVDWTSFTQRKSLVRVLQYMERLQMLRVYEGKSESFSQEAGQEVLYENTGYSKYFTSSFTTDISGYESWKDFEKTDFEEFEETEDHDVLTGYTGSWQSVRHFTGTVQRTLMHYT